MVHILVWGRVVEAGDRPTPSLGALTARAHCEKWVERERVCSAERSPEREPAAPAPAAPPTAATSGKKGGKKKRDVVVWKLRSRVPTGDAATTPDCVPTRRRGC